MIATLVFALADTLPTCDFATVHSVCFTGAGRACGTAAESLPALTLPAGGDTAEACDPAGNHSGPGAWLFGSGERREGRAGFLLK